MSTLSSRELLRALVLPGEQPLFIEDVIEAELDVELLEKFVSKLRPRMDYLRGYKPLDNWFARASHRTLLEEASLAGQHPYCINVLDVGMKDHMGENWLRLSPSEANLHPIEAERGRRFVELWVFLTRKGEWIVWTNRPTSTFKVVTDVKSVLATVAELTPAGASLCDPRGLLRSPALSMFVDLREFLRASTTQKRQAILQDEDILASADASLSGFH